MRVSWVVLVVCLVGFSAGCDKQTSNILGGEERRGGERSTSGAESGAERGAESGGDNETCPLFFASKGLCAAIHWTVGPSIEKKSAFEVRFWQKDRSTSRGPYTASGNTVSALVVKSCGCESGPRLEQLADGEYRVSDILFTEGSWKVFLKVKDAAGEESQFVSVQL